MSNDVFAATAAHIRNPRCDFSLGIFGAIAEFMRDPAETVDLLEELDTIALVTSRGGLRIHNHPQAVLVDYQMPSRHAERRIPARAVCLPTISAGRAGRNVLTEVGTDADALREDDRDAVLFDLGIGLGSVEACIRTKDPDLMAILRAGEGRPVFDDPGLMPALVAHGPHRVFISALARIEVFSPIPPPDGRSPDGPHTHVLPRLLAHQRTHAANVQSPRAGSRASPSTLLQVGSGWDS
ncbi:hypothetical protein LJE71_20065 [Xanthobacter autotrophicus]|uniref:DUF6925 family protein n=1 Tax=Xanthobacter autotrophicus TaxID=280 RepID=UPI001E41CB7F|nr:hypothetical protein [Xanthobacter autotrophicus]UDQ88512.1 hypothetical protein LJE71_20065 [Xanthobacter autotrophicus]